jgi:hypothetical protein
VPGPDARVNAPYPQPGPVAFAGIVVFGVAIVIKGLLTLRVGTEPWWTGFLGLAIILPGLVFIDGGWLWIQREVAFTGDRVVVRRWSEVLRRRPGIVIPLDGRVAAYTSPRNIRSLRIDHDGRPMVVFTLGYWDPRRVDQLLAAFSAHGIAVEMLTAEDPKA